MITIKLTKAAKALPEPIGEVDHYHYLISFDSIMYNTLVCTKDTIINLIKSMQINNIVEYIEE